MKPEAYVEVVPAVSEASLDHSLASVLPHLARPRTRAELERHALYRTHRSELDRLLAAFEWGLGRTSTPNDHRPSLRAVAWNLERGKRFDPALELLRSHPDLRDADLLLLTELDIGMGRSGNRNVPRELATRLGYDYVFANHHVVLGPGDHSERDVVEPNTLSLFGSALLSRHPMRRFASVALPEAADRFLATDKRLGEKRALLVELTLPIGPLVVVIVHLDPFSSPAHRAAQMRLVLEAIARFARGLPNDCPVLLGGDFNTNTYDLGSSLGLLADVARKLLLYGFDGTIAHYLTPEKRFERELFAALEGAGFTLEGWNDRRTGTTFYDIREPKLATYTQAYVPAFAQRWLERRLEPWGGVVPLRVDFFAGRGLRPKRAIVVDRPTWNGTEASDHSPIAVDVTLGA